MGDSKKHFLDIMYALITIINKYAIICLHTNGVRIQNVIDCR